MPSVQTIPVPDPTFDPARLASLEGYEILDTPPEQGFDDVVRLAARLCDTPVALVSLVAADRQWFKARVGFPQCETDLNSSVCAHALSEPDLLVIPDLERDARTRLNPLVTGDPFIRFYAGAPLRTPDGQVLGSLCVIDTSPRPGGLTPDQADDLRALGRQVADLLEMRRSLAARDALIAEQRAVRRERAALARTQAAILEGSGDLDAILEAVTAGALDAVASAEGAVVELVDGDDLEYRSTGGNLVDRRGLRVPLTDSLAGRVARSGVPVLANDVLADDQVRPAMAKLLGMRAATFAPISRAGRVLGVLKLQASAPGAFTERDLELTRLFAGAASAGLTEVAEAEASRSRLAGQRRLDLLARVSAALLAATEPERVAGGILASGAEDLGFDQCYIYEVAPDGRHLMLRYSVGADEAVTSLLRHVGIDGPLCGIVAQTRLPFVLFDVLATSEPRYDLARRSGINSFAGYPITSRGRVVGVMSFCAGGAPFAPATLSFFETVARYLSVARDRVDGEAALRESDTRSRLAQEAGQVGTFEVDIASGLINVSTEFCRLYGVPPSGVYSAESFERLVVPQDRGIHSSDATRRDGSAPPDVEYRIRRADDGSIRWIARRARFLVDETGRPTRMIGTVLDVTALRSAELRDAAMIELGDRLRDSADTASMTTSACETLGRALGANLVGYGDVDDRLETVTVERDWTGPGGISLVGTLRLRDFGTYVDDLKAGRTVIVTDCRSDPRTSGDAEALERYGARAFVNAPVFEHGRFVAMLYVSTDQPRDWQAEELAFVRDVASRVRVAVERVRAEADQRVLNEELSHRLKNTLAMVISIATQTLRSVPDRAPVEAFEQRIHALSTAHDVLLRQSWSAAPMREVVRAVLASAGHGDRIDVSGPEVLLGPRATLSLSLLLHELATNAAKYGALSVQAGRVAVAWSIGRDAECDEEVRLDWRESGGPALKEPSPEGRKGFGSRLIRMGLVGTGGVEMHYRSSGFEASMRAPLDQLQRS